jgi:hypothetical protein
MGLYRSITGQALSYLGCAEAMNYYPCPRQTPPSKKLPRYGQEVRWTKFDGSKHTLEINDCDTLDEAVQTAFREAIKCGWTPPRWWQWWRWGDTPAPTVTIRMMKSFKEWQDEQRP